MMAMQSTGAGPLGARLLAISHSTALNQAAVLVWAVGLLDIVAGGGLPAAVPAAACALFCVLVVPAVNRAGYLPILLALMGLVAFSLQLNSVEPTLQGLAYGTRLGAFMFSVALLRQMLLDLAPLAQARERFAAMVLADQKGAAVLIAGAFGSIFSLGTYTLLGPLLTGHQGEHRRAFGKVMLCGNALALLVTPFSVGWVYVNRLVPVASIAPVIGGLALLWLTGVLVAIALHGRLRASAVWGSVASLAPLAVPLSLYGVLVAVTFELTGLRVTEAITAVTPVVYVAFYLIYGATAGKRYLFARMRDANARAGRSLLEVLLYASSLAFAVAVIQSGIVGHLLGNLLALYPPRMVLVTMALLTPLVGVPGFHPSVPAALGAIVGHAILPEGEAATTVLLLCLCWWASAAMLSISSVSLWGACTEFDCKPRSLILGPNLLVMGAVGVVAGMAIGLGLV